MCNCVSADPIERREEKGKQQELGRAGVEEEKVDVGGVELGLSKLTKTPVAGGHTRVVY
jgi:hypothetical protein